MRSLKTKPPGIIMVVSFKNIDSSCSGEHRPPVFCQGLTCIVTPVGEFPGGILPIMDNMGRLRPEGVPFPGFRYIKG